MIMIHVLLVALIAGLIQNVQSENPYCYTTYKDPCYSSPLGHQEADFIIPKLPQNGIHRQKRGATAYKDFLWPEGKVFYSVANDYSDSEKNAIQAALNHIENNTCIRFEGKKEDTENYINIFPGAGCCSYVGYIGCGEQGVSLSHLCISPGTIIHEILHVLGFYHEHSRPDRDQYVRIIHENIRSGAENNFLKEPDSSINSLGVEYDYNSIMHYCEDAFSTSNEKNTLEPLDPNAVVCGGCQLSPLDVIQINLLYNCDASKPPTLSTLPPPELAKPSLVKPFSCGNVFDEVIGGVFSSPGYDTNQYPHNTACGWVFRSRKGYHLKLSVTLSIEFKAGCTKDYIQGVYVGGVTAKYCGERRLVFSQITEFTLNMVTDSSNGPSSRTYKGISGTFTSTDINECSISNICSHGTCINTKGSYYCICPKGYYLSECNNKCLDINECYEGGHDCDLAVSTCKNTYGSYRCECNDGYKLESHSKTCTKLNATVSCSNENGGCSQVCTEVGTEVSCSCTSGYRLDSDERNCIDINECEDDDGGCKHYCSNTVGSYECNCLDGFELAEDLHACEDINECNSLSDDKNCNGVCYNFPGSYFCYCLSKAGFRYGPDFKSCVDINECDFVNGGCEHNCRNTIGSFQCYCDEGFIVHNQTYCQDVNECYDDNGGCAHKCSNTIGSFMCTCSDGYEIDVQNHKACQDIDECVSGAHQCSHTCTNTLGSYICSCPPGYVLAENQTLCINIQPSLQVCGGNLTNETGSIVFNGGQPNTGDECIWTVAIDDQLKYFQLKIQKMDLNCSKCYIEVINGRYDSGVILGRYCQASSTLISSAINEVTIVYRPKVCDASSFEISYTTTSAKRSVAGCTTVIIPSLGKPQLISSRNFPLTQSAVTSCDVYIFALMNGFKIKVTFLYFDEISDCSGSQTGLKFFNRIATGDTGLVSTICGTSRAAGVGPIYSTTGKALIKYYNTNPTRGFLAKVEIV